MATQGTLAAPARKSRQAPSNPFASGLPDPRPVTDYTATISTVAGHDRITIALAQPCVIRPPAGGFAWGFVSCVDGSRATASSVTVVDNRTLYFDFAGVLDPAVCFIDVPYQDAAVQNFQGGFVRSGGRWFRKAVLP